MISQRLLVALHALNAKREYSAPLELALIKVVEAAEKAHYSDVLPYHLDDPIADALSELERALKDCGV